MMHHQFKNLCLGFFLLSLMILAIILGPTKIPLSILKVWEYWNLDRSIAHEIDQLTAHIFWHLRLPRVLFAALVGGALGYCGALAQGLFRNPLADPGLLGISAGAAAAAAFAIVILPSLSLLDMTWRPLILPLSAFMGALMVSYLLEKSAQKLLPGSIGGLLLMGVAFNAIIAAWIGLCTYLATDEQLRNLSFWTMGSLGAAAWILILCLLICLVLSCARMSKIAAALNVISLGDDVAQHIGVDIKKTRREVIIWISLINGFAVAWCGIISFIGLLAPNMARAMVGQNQRVVIPTSMILGAILLVGADLLARNLAIPTEIPVGIFTALLGGPFFLILLLKGMKS